ncbi:uncharacterized protein N0V89_004359 [Didymosphaeria variabile]|uniref:WDR59/RTC1-like RING zinc finger domain-containing protein n=1 Tax=Didymosphaeria variabile TaxID=1932322 RepID=A0A9W8XQD9_9PLEO|nr:uncharacterized protein N0V89_004359 [Didymosphaeria variabile]KAJ4356327.1 hypothetical protein N0V89_004359 [Didymosphaeria variabile]
MAGPADPFQSLTFEKDVTFDINEEYTAASISPSGRDVVLAGTEGLLIIDLDNPYSPPRFIRHRIGFEVADVQWSPFATRAEWVASTNNNKAVIFNLNHKSSSDHAPIQLTLDAHQGTITDINFSAHHPDVLATCALDTKIFAWDLRTPAVPSGAFSSHLRVPSNNFADWQGGATQVKWNRQNEHILASSHDRYVRIWDMRRGAQPITTIHAHFNKVYGIDWHRTESTKILTCSLDKTIKQWDGAGIVESIDRPTRTILTDYPLLRARHTPFPNGIVAMPQHGSASLSLYKQETSLPSTKSPQHVFTNDDCEGGRLHEFLWRSRGTCDTGFEDRDFQLVTWATDHKLRLYSVSANTLKQAVGFEKGRAVPDPPVSTRKGARYITFANGPVFPKDDDQTNKSQEGNARGGTLSTLLRNNAPPKAGLSSLFHGQTRATMTARTVRRNPAQRVVSSVTWMHNVNIERRKTDGDSKTPEANEEFDLAAEVKAVGQKYPNVSFEVFDPHQRRIVVAFKAPWGEMDTLAAEGQVPIRKTVFLRLTVVFPDMYPGGADMLNEDRYLFPLDITIEKTTAAIAPAMIDHLREVLEQIANNYAYKSQPALAAILSYALGDADLQEIIEPDSEEPEKGTMQESSSEEEEDDDSETGEFNKDLMLSSHSNTNIPLPAQTLVRWSLTGMLLSVRFPRPAVTRIGQTMTSSGLLLGMADPIRLPRHLKQNPSKDDIFETFGRITATYGSESPGSSLVSWESSSSPSTSSGSESEVVFRDFLPPLPWQKISSRLNTKTSVPSSVDPISAYRTKAIITIRGDSVAEFVPSKKILAEEYLIFGDGPTVCLHNSEVARKHGFNDLADIWLLCRLILTNEVPLEILPQSHRRDQVLVLARRALVRIKRKDSGLDLQFDEADNVTNPKLRGRVKWGHHPIVTWLIPALFDHFERLADTQMLAMLSCVFSEPAAREGVPSAMAKMRQSHLPMSMEAPAFSLDYFASPGAAWSLFKPTVPMPSTPAHSKFATPVYEFGWHRLSKNLDTYGSHGSSNGPWGSDILPSEPVTPYSTGNTPPNISRAPTLRSVTMANTPYSTSPEQTQTIGKKISSAGFSNALANLGKSFISASPPVKSRTDDLSTSLPASGVTWGTTTFYSSGSQERGLAAPRVKQGKRASFGQADQVNVDYISDSDSDYDTLGPDVASEQTAPIPSSANDDGSSRIKVTLKNQDQFDNEACVSAPLLDMSKEGLYRAWREQYAELLGCWGLISKRAEVLKFNGLVSYFPFDEVSESKAGSMHLALKKDGDRGGSRMTSRTLSRSSTLAPGLTLPQQFRRSPLPSPRGFSFNPEALEFKPGTSFQPVSEVPAPPADVFTASEQYLRLSIPTPATEAQDPFNLPLGGSKLSPYAHKASRPSLSRGTSNVSGRSSLNVPTNTANSPTKKNQNEPIYSCSICWIRVSGRFYLCPACGHVAHFDCLANDEGFDEGECVVGCGCGCGFETSRERSRIEEFLDGVRSWEERGGWLPEIEFDEDAASTRAYRPYEANYEEEIHRWAKEEKGRKKEGGKGEKAKGKRKARLTGKSYF